MIRGTVNRRNATFLNPYAKNAQLTEPVAKRDARILSSPTTPKTASDHFPVAFHFKGKDYNYKLKPDIGPIGIKYPNGIASSSSRLIWHLSRS